MQPTMRFEYGSSSNAAPVSRKRDYQAGTGRVNASVSCDDCYLGCEFLSGKAKIACQLLCSQICE
jgi:hypothetical protein